jgi:hypothetical protein
LWGLFGVLNTRKNNIAAGRTNSKTLELPKLVKEMKLVEIRIDKLQTYGLSGSAQAAHTWMENLLNSMVEPIKAAKKVIATCSQGHYHELKKSLEVDLRTLRPIEGGAVEGDGTLWHREVPNDCTFVMLQNLAKNTIMKVKGQTIDSLASVVEEV